jgi:hypothetical protein
MSDYKLQIKDGDGSTQELRVNSSSAGLVPYHAVSGAVNTVMHTEDLSAITASMSEVSSAIGLFNEQLYQALTGGPVSMSVDIVAGDVNAITGAIDLTTAEITKLTALSGSDGLKVHTLTTASVNLVNTGSLTASISNWPNSYVVTSSYTQPVVVVQSGSVSSVGKFAFETGTDAYYEYDDFITEGEYYFEDAEGLSLTIQNNTNGYLYIRLSQYGVSAIPVTTSSYNIRLDHYSTYEAKDTNSRMRHTCLLNPNTTSGSVTLFTTH